MSDSFEVIPELWLFKFKVRDSRELTEHTLEVIIRWVDRTVGKTGRFVNKPSCAVNRERDASIRRTFFMGSVYVLPAEVPKELADVEVEEGTSVRFV